MCSFQQKMKDNETINSYKNLGKVSDATFKISSSSEAYLIYKKNENTTTIRLVCVNIPKTYLFIEPSSAKDQAQVFLFNPYIYLFIFIYYK